MSNVFKPFQANSADERTRQISIRNLHIDIKNQEEPKSIDALLTERAQSIEAERRVIENEKKQIDEMRRIAAEDIESMQLAWAEEKLQLQKQAYDEGFQIGFTEGHNKALADMSASIDHANEITKKSQEAAVEYQASQESVILELAMKAAEQILNETLRENDERFLSVVRKALLEVRETKEIKLYVSVKYYDFVQENRSELAAIFPPTTPFLIFANEEFDDQECFIETNHGRIVVSIDEQLNELRERLIEVLEMED